MNDLLAGIMMIEDAATEEDTGAIAEDTGAIGVTVVVEVVTEMTEATEVDMDVSAEDTTETALLLLVVMTMIDEEVTTSHEIGVPLPAEMIDLPETIVIGKGMGKWKRRECLGPRLMEQTILVLVLVEFISSCLCITPILLSPICLLDKSNSIVAI